MLHVVNRCLNIMHWHILFFAIFFNQCAAFSNFSSLNYRTHRQIDDSIVFIDEFDQGHRRQTPCKFLGRAAGNCLPLRDCPPLLSLLQNPVSGNLEVLQQSLCGYTNNLPQVCCPDLSEISALNEPGPPPPVRPPLPNRPLPPSQPIQQLPLVPPPNLPRSCGISQFLTTRIVGGKESAIGSWPWMAALVYTIPDGSLFFGCGGALITDRHVLTAAHCTSEGQDILKSVRLGAHYLPQSDVGFQKENVTPWVQVDIKRKIIHPEYVRKKLSKNDIAILELTRKVPFTDYIRPVCLPWQDEVRNRDLLGKKAVTAGWGTTLFNKKEPSSFLQHVSMPIADFATCKQAYSKIKTSIVFDETVLCAGDGSGKADSCQGDSGGPLMMDIDGVYQLVGVVSSGYRCAEPGFFGVYMKTTHYLDWIFKNI